MSHLYNRIVAQRQQEISTATTTTTIISATPSQSLPPRVVEFCRRLHDDDPTIAEMMVDYSVIGAFCRRLHTNDVTLTKIELLDVFVDNDEAKALADALKKNATLRTLELRNNRMGNVAAMYIAAALLGGNNSTLRRLGLNGNNVGYDGIHAISKALTENVTLEKLGLYGNPQVGQRLDGVSLLSNALHCNRTLKRLWLDGCNIDNDGAQELANALKCNHVLQLLGLGNNHIGDVGAKAILEALQSNQRSNLQQLGLRGNRIHDRCILLTFINLLSENMTIQVLDLQGNAVMTRARRGGASSDLLEMEYYLELNRRGRERLVMDAGTDGGMASSSTNITDIKRKPIRFGFLEDWVDLLASADMRRAKRSKFDLDWSFYVLQRNPTLCSHCPTSIRNKGMLPLSPSFILGAPQQLDE